MQSLVLGLAFTLAAPAREEPPKNAPAYAGDWVTNSIIVGGAKIESPVETVTITADSKLLKNETGKPSATSATFTVDLSKKPAEIDFTEMDEGKSRVKLAIFKIEGETLTICVSLEDGSRPTKFESTFGMKTVLFVLKRAARK